MKNLFILLSLVVLMACTENRLPEQADGLYAIIETNKGDIVSRLEYKKAPLTVANFVGLAEGSIENNEKSPGEPFFDGLTFHRVVPGFVVQGGDPQANGMGGPGYKFRQEIDPDLTHNVPGTLAMANAGPGTNGSQFYITHVATPQLDGGYNVFGYVVEGLPIVYKIALNDTIRHIEIVRKGPEASKFDAPAVFAAERNK